METYHRNMIRRWVLSLHKTVRKYFGEAVVVTQELDDIVSSPIIKDTIINNADCKILLDQRKYINKFDSVQSLLGLTDKEKDKSCLSIRLTIRQGSIRKFGLVWVVSSLLSMQQRPLSRSISPIPQKKPKSWKSHK